VLDGQQVGREPYAVLRQAPGRIEEDWLEGDQEEFNMEELEMNAYQKKQESWRLASARQALMIDLMRRVTGSEGIVEVLEAINDVHEMVHDEVTAATREMIAMLGG
jgi:hypothetical protein